jgi:hypothetical protein
VLTAFAVAATSPAAAQVAYVAVASADAGLEGFRHLAPLAGKGQWPGIVEAYLRLKTGAAGLDGLDAKRPLGAYLLWPGDIKDLASPKAPVVLFVPVADEKRFVDLLGKLGCKPQRGDGGLYRLSVPGLPDLSLRFAHGHAYAAARAELLRDPLPPPASFLPPFGPERLLTAAVRVEHFPKDAERQIAESRRALARHLQAMFGEETKRQGETEAEFQQRQGQRVGMNRLAKLLDDPTESRKGADRLLKEVRELSLTCDLDPKGHQITLDLAVVPQPESGLAAFCDHAGTTRCRFGHLAAGSVGSLVLHIPGLDEGREFLTGTTFDTFRTVAGDFLPARYREWATKATGIFMETIVVDGFDFAVVSRKPRPGEAAVVLAGVKVQNGRKLDHLFRDIIKDLPAADREGWLFRLNCDRHGRARIHRIESEGDYVLVAFREDLILFASEGKDAAILKAALDAHDKALPSPTLLLQIEVTGPWLAERRELAEALAKAVPKEEQDKVKARLSLRGGKDLRLRIESSTYLIPLPPKIWE